MSLSSTETGANYLNDLGQYVPVSGGASYTAGPGISIGSNAISVVYGSTSGTAAQGNDTRLSLASTAFQPGASYRTFLASVRRLRAA